MQAQANSSAWKLQPAIDMSTEQFVDWCQLVEDRTGIVLNEQRRSLLQVSLNSRMLELGLSDYSDYYQKVLVGPSGAVEWATLVDRLTVKETIFFRHPPSYHLVSQYLADKLKKRAANKPINLLSVGCSTGEEAWSLAITVAEALRTAESECNFAITAIDISARALQAARSGCYSSQRLSVIEPELLHRYFEPAKPNQYQVRQDIKNRMCFGRFNVLDIADLPTRNVDIIFCQNLLIYFRRWQRREILNHLANRLAPGGLLVIGLGEITGWEHPELQIVDNKQVLAFTRKGK